MKSWDGSAVRGIDSKPSRGPPVVDDSMDSCLQTPEEENERAYPQGGAVDTVLLVLAQAAMLIFVCLPPG